MKPGILSQVNTLAFDILGTVLDLTGSLLPPIRRFLEGKGAPVRTEVFWDQWRARQRIEQYQDALMMLGHSGYLETCRRALVYCLRLNAISHTDNDVRQLMEAWQGLSPHRDVVAGLQRLKGRYKLVALSNGEQWYLERLAKERINAEFDAIISVQKAGVFKPHPAVYRTGAMVLGKEPSEIMMVASHSFDIMGARACGYRGAYVDRYRLPFEDTPYQPDIAVKDFIELADVLGA